MVKNMRFIPAILCLFVFISCEKTEPEPITVVTVDQDFELVPSQEVDENGSKYLLVVRSLEPDSCSNATLDASYTIEGQKITIVINGNQTDGPCESGEIFTEKTFTLPSDLGVYDIEFIKGELVSTTGTLNINEGDFNLSVDNLGGIFLETTTIKKVPDYLVWGYAADRETVTSTQIFLEEMETELAFGIPVYENLEIGNYGLFTVNVSGEIELDDVKLDHTTFAFKIDDELVWEKLIGRLPNFSTNLPRLKYTFYRWDGIVIEN